MTPPPDPLAEVAAILAAVPKLDVRGMAATSDGVMVLCAPYPYTPQTLVSHVYDAMRALGTRRYSVAVVVTPGVNVEELRFMPLRKDTP